MHHVLRMVRGPILVYQVRLAKLREVSINAVNLFGHDDIMTAIHHSFLMKFNCILSMYTF